MNYTDRIYVAGHKGMVGSAILRKLKKDGYENIITKTSAELDLRDCHAVADFFDETQPQYIFLAAAKVGGILANNNYKADFLYDNLAIQTNVIYESHIHNVEKLLFLGSSCIYPKMAPQPIKEEYLLTGPLEPTNDAYALAKIAGIYMCSTFRQQYGCNFISVMPTNLYGVNDNYNSKNSHVLPALIKKFYTAIENDEDEVMIWGTGKPMREFLYVDDLADACLFLMQHYNDSAPINIGAGEDISIKELAELIKKITGFKGKIKFDTSMPDGTPRKLLDLSKLRALSWQHTIALEDGIRLTCADFKKRFYSIPQL